MHEADDDLLSCRDVAARLGTTATWVRILCERGRIAARKVGGVWLITRAALAAYSPRPRGNPNFGRRADF